MQEAIDEMNQLEQSGDMPAAQEKRKQAMAIGEEAQQLRQKAEEAATESRQALR